MRTFARKGSTPWGVGTKRRKALEPRGIGPPGFGSSFVQIQEAFEKSNAVARVIYGAAKTNNTSKRRREIG